MNLHQNEYEMNKKYFESLEYQIWRKLAGLDDNNIKKCTIFNFDIFSVKETKD
jgi:hypothetical protein